MTNKANIPDAQPPGKVCPKCQGKCVVAYLTKDGTSKERRCPLCGGTGKAGPQSK